MNAKAIDVLLLHGGSLDLIRDLKDFLESLGVQVGTVIDQTSPGDTQKGKVERNIKASKFLLLVATFDEEVTGARSVRPNFVHELTICLKTRKRDTYVLVETRDGTHVSVGTNLEGHYDKHHFDKKSIHKIYPILVRTLRDRKLLPSSPVSGVNTSLDNTSLDLRLLSPFMNKMDLLWEKGFDAVYDKIPRIDHETWIAYGDALDEFFYCYWRVFDAFRNRLANDELQNIALREYRNAQEELEKVWKNTAKALIGRAHQLRQGRNKVSRSLLPSLQSADEKLREARNLDNIEQRTMRYMEAVKKLDVFINRSESRS